MSQTTSTAAAPKAAQKTFNIDAERLRFQGQFSTMSYKLFGKAILALMQDATSRPLRVFWRAPKVGDKFIPEMSLGQFRACLNDNKHPAHMAAVHALAERQIFFVAGVSMGIPASSGRGADRKEYHVSLNANFFLGARNDEALWEKMATLIKGTDEAIRIASADIKSCTYREDRFNGVTGDQIRSLMQFPDGDWSLPDAEGRPRILVDAYGKAMSFSAQITDFESVDISGNTFQIEEGAPPADEQGGESFFLMQVGDTLTGFNQFDPATGQLVSNPEIPKIPALRKKAYDSECLLPAPECERLLAEWQVTHNYQARQNLGDFLKDLAL